MATHKAIKGIVDGLLTQLACKTGQNRKKYVNGYTIAGLTFGRSGNVLGSANKRGLSIDKPLRSAV
ncbi:MAG: hypothetical protein ABI690_29500 [Chloroflexota bacterium]